MRDPGETSEAILAAVASLLAESSFDEITYRHVGEATRLSERTVYRHFPTRSHLLAAVAAWLETQYFRTAAFSTWHEFDAAISRRFREFDALPDFAFLVARAEAVSPIDETGPGFVAHAIEVLIEQTMPGLNRRDTQRMVAALSYLSSAQFWARCRIGFTLNGEEIIDSSRASRARVLATSPRAPEQSHLHDESVHT